MTLILRHLFVLFIILTFCSSFEAFYGRLQDDDANYRDWFWSYLNDAGHRNYRSQNRPEAYERQIYREDSPPIYRDEQPAFNAASGVSEDEQQIDAINREDTPTQSVRAQPLPTTGEDEKAPEVYQKADVVKEQKKAPLQPEAHVQKKEKNNATNDVYFVAVVGACSAAAVFGVIAAGFCWYKLQKNAKAAAEAEYPAYGVTGPSKDHASPPSGDRKLAQSAQMYHYQHQKQQMIAIEKANSDRHVSTSDMDSEEENEEGDYTVYECPGLAPTGEMEVKNPLFQDEPTPASPPVTVKEPQK